MLALTVHEFSHGFAAFLLGDNHARDHGRLSLNPIRHIDPIGFLFILTMGFGWAKPVMIDTYRFKDPKNDMAITAFAGPLSNLVLAFACLMIIVPMERLYTGSSQTVIYFYSFLQIMVTINLILAVFNMLPLPPLDGSKVFGVALPRDLYFRMMSADRIGFVILIVLLWTGQFGRILSPIMGGLRGALLFVVQGIYFFL
ncbi:MAG: site-2 protease family protein [Defluviitaleaceae bacterium]|nr:site-2 protease family protein [Defluviitaleaceae bacterium]